MQFRNIYLQIGFFFCCRLFTLFGLWRITIPTKKIGDLDINGREKEDVNRGEVQETKVGTLLKKLDGEECCKEDERVEK